MTNKEERSPRGRHGGRGRDHVDMVAMALADGALSLPEIEDNFLAFLRRFGFFAEYRYHREEDLDRLKAELEHDLRVMIELGWVEAHDGRYRLTPLGQEQAALRLERLRRVGSGVRRLLHPEGVTRVAVGTHLLLAALKLPAGLLSGSAGLINDAADTLLDGLSSLLVYLGIRLNRVRAVNGLLVLLMLGTGGLALVEALRRVLGRIEPKVDLFAFVAILTSGLVCSGLGAYQRYVGLRSGNLTLITQSIDSRNHVIIALGVTAGLSASLLGVEVVDGLIGVAVALLILRSGFEVALDLVRTLRGEQVDLSRYRPALAERLDELRLAQFRDWTLFLIYGGKASTRSELVKVARKAQDFDRYPVLREIGLGGRQPAEGMIAEALAELVLRDWIQGDERLQVTRAGRAHLEESMRRPRRAMRPHAPAIDPGKGE